MPKYLSRYNWIGCQVYAHEKLIPEKPTGLRQIRDHVWKALGKKSPNLLCVFLCDPIFTSFQNIFPNNVQTKLCMAESDSPCQILLFKGRRPFWGATVCSVIIFLGISGSPADLRAFDNIVLACTSNSLVRNIIFLIFLKVLFNKLKLRSWYASDLLTKKWFELKRPILCLKNWKTPPTWRVVKWGHFEVLQKIK